MPELLEQILSIVRQAGDIVRSARDIAAGTKEKSFAGDLVTAYDLAVENFLKERLPSLVPGSIFFGEEEKENADPSRGWAFIVDPIDGTANFVRELRRSAISVALARDAAVEYAPYRDEMFSARRGGGAFLNGAPIRVSEKPLAQGIFSMGTSLYRPEYFQRTMRLTEQLFRRSCDFRRMGAAALDFCDVACGRTEAFFEYSLCPWDYAAGSLLVTEAGGAVCTLEGGPLPVVTLSSAWAANWVNRDILKELEV